MLGPQPRENYRGEDGHPWLGSSSIRPGRGAADSSITDLCSEWRFPAHGPVLPLTLRAGPGARIVDITSTAERLFALQ